MRMVKYFVVICVVAQSADALAASPKLDYVKKATRAETLKAALKSLDIPELGSWYYIGPFDNTDRKGFGIVYPPEEEIDLEAEYEGKSGRKVIWRKGENFVDGKTVNLRRFYQNENAACYLYRRVTAKKDRQLPISLGSDDTITVWLNGEQLLAKNVYRDLLADQEQVTLDLKKGDNDLLFKICNETTDWAFVFRLALDPLLEVELQNRLERDFPPGDESKYYRMMLLPTPPDEVIEVGGLDFADGKLWICTRRGDIWTVDNPLREDITQMKYTRFASGLQEALGLNVTEDGVYIVQRSELTRLNDTDGDGVADEYNTVYDGWGISGNYHEFAFGLPRDRNGNFVVTLNLGFRAPEGESLAPYRGWALSISPEGKMTTLGCGLRSPNGVGINAVGDLFCCDNQGDWIETCKLNHLRPGKFYGQPFSLRWKDNPGVDYEKRVPEELNKVRTRPAIWFPYNKMGTSSSGIICDLTGGKFGPFAEQLFIGDQEFPIVSRVALEKVGGEYQGACFPFRKRFPSGTNALTFAPDGSLFVGETDRGWGSVGRRSWGLTRIIHTGIAPFDILTMKLRKDGFDLTFTKPVDRAKAADPASYSLQDYWYKYHKRYGSEEEGRRAIEVLKARVSDDGKTVTLKTEALQTERVVELHLAKDFIAADGTIILHPEAYYTLNQMP